MRFLNLSNLSRVGWAGKRYVLDIQTKVKLEDPPEYIKAGLQPKEEKT